MRETSGRRVMRIMEGQGVDGHVDDESSPKRNAFVRVFENVSLFSLLSSLLSCLVLSWSWSWSWSWSCLVLWCVCGRVLCVQRTPRSLPQERWSGTPSSDIANDRRNRERVVLDLFSNFKRVRSKGFFGEPLGSSDNIT